SYKIPASNPFGICSYKTLDLKSFRICSYEKRGIYPLVLVPAKRLQLSPGVMGRSATYAKVENTQMRARRIKVEASSGAYEVICAAWRWCRFRQRWWRRRTVPSAEKPA